MWLIRRMLGAPSRFCHSPRVRDLGESFNFCVLIGENGALIPALQVWHEDDLIITYDTILCVCLTLG